MQQQHACKGVQVQIRLPLLSSRHFVTAGVRQRRCAVQHVPPCLTVLREFFGSHPPAQCGCGAAAACLQRCTGTDSAAAAFVTTLRHGWSEERAMRSSTYAFVSVCLSACLPACLLFFICSFICSFIYSFMRACMHTCMNECMNVCMHACM